MKGRKVVRQYEAGERDFSGVDLRGADLRGVDLSGANLHGANLSGADLSGANLSEARLSEANLSAAISRKTNSHEANPSVTDSMRDVSLRAATVSDVQVVMAILRGVTLPRGTKHD